jgi:nicotinate-nucleotide--dimethylbenzimidazole phosphoribosyltransferase
MDEQTKMDVQQSETPARAPAAVNGQPSSARSTVQPRLEAEQVWARLDGLAKPRRSLGKLEEVAVRLATVQRTLQPVVRPRRLVLFAGDHGVVVRGVSAWPSEVTGLMVGTILMGRASSSALAAAHDCSVRLVDVGVAGARVQSPPPFFRDARVDDGTRDLSAGPAMTAAQFGAAWQVGVDEAERAVAEGCRVLIAGEMGIGNTTPAACLTMLFTHVGAEVAVGRGAGADDTTLQTKRDIVAAAVARALAATSADVGGARTAVDDPSAGAPLRAAIEALSGFEIVAMAGFFAAGARLGATLLVDGYVATSAALIAWHLQPESVNSMIAGHRSAESGHGAALACLGLEPLLDWNMRLGEGTGALVALPMLDSAAALLCDVAALSDLGVARED